MSDMDLDELAGELADLAKPKKVAKSDPRAERIIAGFEEIQKFVEENGRVPQVGADKDIFERIYAIRLEQIRKQSDCREIVQEFDHQGLLDSSEQGDDDEGDDISDDELLAELGELSTASDVRKLKHVRPRAEVKAAEQIANRQRCADFDKFKPVFDTVQKELETGIRETRPYQDDGTVEQGNFFILSGQKVFIASVGEEFINDFGHKDVRVRAIYDNGTEQDILRRSLQRALNKDETGRRITDPVAGPLFTSEHGEGDTASGTIYVLRSNAEIDIVKNNRDVLHKIGVTGKDVKTRIAQAENDATYLLAGVEVVATYELYNINRNKLEKLIHRFFENARLDIQIKDRFGKPVTPREWFLVPLYAIDEMVEKLKDGTLSDYKYDMETAKIVKR